MLQITRQSHRSLRVDTDAIGRESSAIDKSKYRLHKYVTKKKNSIEISSSKTNYK